MFQLHDVVELISLVVSVLASTVFLASRIQRIEDTAIATRVLLDKHIDKDDRELTRLYDKLDRKADRP